MQMKRMEEALLERLEKGLLDGTVGKDADLGAGKRYRAVIRGGIPQIILLRGEEKIPRWQFCGREEKLWFLRHHGWRMTDPCAVCYSHRCRIPRER